MNANTLSLGSLGTFTRIREQNDSSLYRNLASATEVTEEIRIAHRNAGKTPEGVQQYSHLFQYSKTTNPTGTNLLLKPKKIVMNLTFTGTKDAMVSTELKPLIDLIMRCLADGAYVVPTTHTTAGLTDMVGFVAGEI